MSTIEGNTKTIQGLIARSKGIEPLARRIQEHEPSTATVRDVEYLHEQYYEWYAECLPVLPDDLYDSFTKEFEGGFFTQKIKHFLSNPITRNILWREDLLDSSNPIPIGFFQHPVERCFLAPLRQQQGLLVQVKKRLEAHGHAVRSIERTPILPNREKGQEKGATVFIGHGRSLIYKHVETFIDKRLGLNAVTFEGRPRSRMTNVDVLRDCLDRAHFAVLVLTAEDETIQGGRRARQNVVHEIGLFQGRLGFKRVALLRQQGAEEFSNLVGLQELRFENDNIRGVFEDLRSVLEREQLV